MKTRYSRGRAIRELLAYSREDGPIRLPEHLRILLRAAARILETTRAIWPTPTRSEQYDIQEYKTAYHIDPGYLRQGGQISEAVMHHVRATISNQMAHEVLNHMQLDSRRLPGGTVEITGRIVFGTPKQETLRPVRVADWQWQEAIEEAMK